MGKKGSKKKGKRNTQSPKQSKLPRDHSSRNSERVVPSTATKAVVYRPVPGLVNLGNTCFFNSVIQSLSQSQYFRLRLQHLQSTPTFEQELQLPNSEEVLKVRVIEELGPLTTNLRKLLQSMVDKTAGTLNPHPVFSEICKKVSRFSSHAQQDSQELLHHLLDAIRQEEIHRIKHAILVHHGMGKNGTASKNLTDDERVVIKAYGRQATQCRTFVDEVFGGTLVSTVTCDVCKSCTKVQETFLDLSLPIGDDEPQVDNYKNKNKKNKFTSSNDAHAEVQSTNDVEEKESGMPYSKKPSKHQLKKMDREKRKAQKKANKMKVHHLSGLDQLIKPPSLPDSSTSMTNNLEGIGNSVSPIPSDHESSDEDQEAKDTAHRELVDPATGEPTCDTPTPNQEGRGQASDDPTPDLGESTQQPQSASESVDIINIDNEAIANGGHDQQGFTSDLAREYASSGPQVDTQNAAPREMMSGTTGSASASLQIDAQNTAPRETTSDSTGSALADGNLNSHSNAEQVCDNDEVTNGDSGRQESTGDEHGEKEKGDRVCSQEPEPEPNSVEWSLKEFCATEQLEGDNKFACIQCTNEAIEEKRAKQAKIKIPVKEEEKKLEREDSNGNTCGAEKEEDSNHHSPALSRECSEEDDSQNTEIEDSHEFCDVYLENKDYLSDIKFCNATKKLLIQTPPIVLTLHIKRFSQHGRHLRKNSKHIKFPFRLDLSQHCMRNGDHTLCDQSGRMLYSLVAVVEHSGSMFGGHYVAYVKQRHPVSPVQLERTCTWRVPNLHSMAADTMTYSPTSDNSVVKTSTSSPTPDNSIITSSPTPDNSAGPSTSSPTPDNSAGPSTSSPTPDNSAGPSTSSPTPDNSAGPSTSSPTPDNSVITTPSASFPSLEYSFTPNNAPPITDNSTTSAPSAPDNSTTSAPSAPDSCHADVNDSTISCIDDAADNTLPSTPADTENNTNMPTASNHTPVNTFASAPDNSLGDLPSTSKTSISSDSSSSTDKSSPTPDSPTPDTESNTYWQGEPAESVHGREFDESVTEGQWYLVSDSHVTKSSPEDVQRSQAYLLFYELLPFRT